jgi:hypothetical protein
MASVIGVVVAVLLIAGAAAAYFTLPGAPATVVGKVPAGADAVVVAHLDPGASQKMHLLRMAASFPDLQAAGGLSSVDELIDDALLGTGLTHDDLDWVGGEVGGYVTVKGLEPSGAILLAADDEDAAAAALAEAGGDGSSASIDGVEVTVGSDGSAWAIVDGTAVIANDEDAMRAVIATANGEPSIEDDPTYQGVMDRLPQDNLGFGYANLHDLAGVLQEFPGFAPTTVDATAGLAAAQGVGVAVSAGPDGLALDVATTTDPAALTQAQRDALAAADGPNDLLSLMPADALAVEAVAGGTTGFDRSLKDLTQFGPEIARDIERLGLLGPKGLLAHLTGDLGVQVGKGTGPLPVGGTVLVGIDDPDAVRAWLDKRLPKLVGDAAFGPLDLPWKTEDHDGVQITYLDGFVTPLPLAYAVLDDAAVIGLSVKDVETAVDLSHGKGTPITTDPDFVAATGTLPGLENVVYVDVSGILATVEAFLPGEAFDEFEASGGRNLHQITVVVAGEASDESGSQARLLIGIPEED